MDAANQLNIFLICLCAGFVGGILYEPFAVLHKFLRGKAASAALDIAFFLLFAAFSVGVSAVFALPGFRVYMYAGNILGLILYAKSIRRIVDFSQKVCYNRVRKGLKRRKSTKNSKKKEVQTI